MTPDQTNQLISLLSGLLTIIVGALVRHYLPPRDGRPSEDDSAPAGPSVPTGSTDQAGPPDTSKESPPRDGR